MSNDNITIIESLKESYNTLNHHYSQARYVYRMEPTGMNERLMHAAKKEVEHMENKILDVMLSDDPDKTPRNFREAEEGFSFESFDPLLYAKSIEPTDEECDHKIGMGIRALGKHSVDVSGVTYNFSTVLYFDTGFGAGTFYYQTMVWVNEDHMAFDHTVEGSFEKCADYGAILMSLICEEDDDRDDPSQDQGDLSDHFQKQAARQSCPECDGVGFIIVCAEEGVKARCEACS